MERSHSASSGSTRQDDSWTCQRCGWVYPNAHPSAKHRRNHKKQCGKIKGFELRSEHKGGSSDEASSDDESHGKKESLPPRSPQAQHDGIRPIEAGSAVPAVEQPNGLQSRDLPVTEVNVSIPAAEHPSGLQSRDLPVTEVDVSSEVKLDTSIPAVEYPSGLQFRDLPVTKVDVSDEGKLDTSIPAVEHPSASQSRDLPVTAVNVSDTVKLDTPVLQGISAALDVKPETPAYGSTQNFITGDVAKSEFPEHVPNTVFLNNTSTAFGEGKVMHATLVDTVEAPTLVLPRLDTKEAKEFVEQDTKFEDAPIELTREIALKTPEGHAKSDHASKIDRVEGVARDLPGLDIDLANSAQKKDAKSEGSAPEPAQSVASLDEPSRTLEEQSKVSLTPCVDEIAIAAQVSRGFDSGQARESHKKESSSIPKEQAANGLGSSHSSRDDDSWTCNRCGWVYPNPHPSAKHRRNHKKQCGKIKGFELRTEPHEGGSSDEVSSDGEMNVKKEHLPHPSPQILEAQDQANNPAATGSTPPGDDDPAVFREGRISTESGSSNLQSRDLSSSKGETPDKELSDTPNLTDFLTPDIKSSDVVPEVPENMASLVQQLPPEAENQKGAAVLDQITVVLCGPDTSETKELPKHSSLKEDTLPNPAIVQENLGSSETQLTTVISISKIVSTSASEGLDDQVKDTLVEYGLTNMLVETPDGPSGDCTPKVATSPSVPDECGSTNTLAETPDGLSGDCTPKVASIPSVSDDRGSTNMLAEIPEGLSGNCTPMVASIPLVPDDPKSTSMLAETPETPDRLSEDCTPKVACVPSVPDDPGSTNMLAEIPENSDGLSGDFTPKVAISPSVPDDCVSTNMLAETPGGLSGDCTPKVASIPSVPDDPGSTDRLAETPDGLSGDCTPKVASIPSARDDPGSANMLAETPEYPDGLLGDCAPKVASIPSVLDDYGSTNMLAEAPDGLSGDCTPKVASIPSGSDDRGSTNMLAETSDGLSGDCTLKFASIPPVPDSLPSSSSPAYIENKGASILKVDEPRLVVTAMDFGASGLSNETLDASTGAGLNQSVVITEGTDVSEKPGLDASSNFKNLDAMDHLLVHDPLRKETEETMTGGLEGRDGLLVLDKISSDLSPLTLTADKVLVENMPVKENLFSSTADVFGSANDSEEDGRFLSAQTSLNSTELITQNESMSEKVVRGNDDACSTGINKTDESTHSLEKQGTPVGVAEVDFSKEVTTTADTTQEAIQGGLDIPGHVTSKNVSLNSEDFGQGVALVSAGGNTEITNTESSIAKDSYMSDKIKENETGGSYSVIDGHQVEITEAVEKPEVKEGTPCETRGIGSSNLSYTESGAGGNSSAIDGHQVKIAENGHAPEAVEKPEGKEDTPRETRGIESSDLSYPETNSVTRSETGVAGRLGLGASAHKLSDSLEIYEDAADSLETCSVGGSVEENENLDEPRQALDGVPEEPKRSGVALLDKRVPGESVGLDEEPSILNGSTTGEAVPGEIVGLYKEPSILNGLNGSSAGEAVSGESVGLDKKTSILNGSSAGEAISEEKITTLPGVSYAVRSKVEDLKAPSPEAWQEPGPSHVKSEGKRKISSTSEVTEDGRSGESHTALRSLMAKEGPEKVDQIVESITSAGDPQNLNKTGGSLASRNGTKPKSRSFWSHCICCPTVH